MSAIAYAVASDLYSHGLPRGSLPNPGRLAASVDVTSNTFALDQHGFSLNDPVTFRAESGGTLPTPLAPGVVYFAIPVTDDAFALSVTASGSSVDLTTAGARVLVIAPLPIASAISWASRVIDNMLPAHIVPLVAPIPEIVVMTCAELAAGKLLRRQGAESKSLGEIVDAATKRLERWAAGIPIRGDSTAQTPANLAARASIPFSDARGWSRFGGPGPGICG